MVQTLGWKLFGPYVLAAVGLAGDDEIDVLHDVESLVDSIVAEAGSAASRAQP